MRSCLALGQRPATTIRRSCDAATQWPGTASAASRRRRRSLIAALAAGRRRSGPAPRRPIAALLGILSPLTRIPARATCLRARSRRRAAPSSRRLGRLSHPTRVRRTSGAPSKTAMPRCAGPAVAHPRRSSAPAGMARDRSRRWPDRIDPSAGRAAGSAEAALAPTERGWQRGCAGMTFQSETAGHSAETGLPVLREPHARTHRAVLRRTDATRSSRRARSAPLVDRRAGSGRSSIYVLPAEVRRRRVAAGWRQVLDALVGARRPSFWREIDQIRAHRLPGRARSWHGARAAADPDLERAVRDRRGAADDRDGARARRAGSTARPIEIHGSDGSPARDRQGARPGATGSARCGRCRRRCSESILRRRRRRRSRPRPELPARITLVERREPDAPAETCAPFARSPIVFCRNAFIYFSPQAIKQRGRPVRRSRCRRPATCASARRNRC